MNGPQNTTKYFRCSASPPKLPQFLKGKFPWHKLIQHIWQVRNKVIFEGVEPDLESLKIVLARIVAEHLSLAIPPNLLYHSRWHISWSFPAPGTLKINVNAAVGTVNSMVAQMARDQRERLVSACSKRVNTNFPLQAEAS